LEKILMNDSTQFGGTSQPDDNTAQLAQWLLQVLAPVSPGQGGDDEGLADEEQHLSLLWTDDYHLPFYRQLPDFIMALLNNDPQATVYYAPLLYHLVGCSACYTAYLDLYDSLRAAIYPRGARPLLGQGTRTLAATPHRMLSHLCQTFISQAKAVLRQARHDHNNRDETARSLLLMALRVSVHIAQSGLRREALKDLVHVATLFDGPTTAGQEDPHTYAYSPVLTGTGNRSRIVRRADTLAHSNSAEYNSIELQSHALTGRIVQNGQILELQLQDLQEALRGRYVTISVLLGSLLEPVRWRGGNPRAIRSIAPVQMDGTLVTPLGQTDLLLQIAEERNLLEAMFLLIEVRAIDSD
jgi:hypothetical protein